MKLPFFLENDDPSMSEYVLVANPHYYDYLHYLIFKEEGVIELVDGAGQVINVEAKGKYRIQTIDQNSAEIDIYEVIEVNPYKQGQKIREIEPLKVKVSREEGNFPFREETVWKIEKEEEWPCCIKPGIFLTLTL